MRRFPTRHSSYSIIQNTGHLYVTRRRRLEKPDGTEFHPNIYAPSNLNTSKIYIYSPGNL